ncbi:hypothetical protein [Zavarzinia sp. CC-PAN008]|uniref:hypothetical protein n=1 Tax=Zavarzinia sp. CC-PAN008 TaxID=3243332 RepID=UPI003F749A9D
MKWLGLPLLTLAVIAAPAWAHEAEGPHGGVLVDAGPYHVELVTRDTRADLYLTVGEGEPVPPAGFKATAILIVDGKAQRITLDPSDGDRLSGTAAAPLPPRPKGVVQFTAPDGKTAQGQFK